MAFAVAARLEPPVTAILCPSLMISSSSTAAALPMAIKILRSKSRLPRTIIALLMPRIDSSFCSSSLIPPKALAYSRRLSSNCSPSLVITIPAGLMSIKPESLSTPVSLRIILSPMPIRAERVLLPIGWLA